MKSLNVAVLSLLLFAGAAANGRPTAGDPAAPVKTETGKDSVTAKADVLPSFRGGPERLAEYLRVNLRYPKEEVAAGTAGLSSAWLFPKRAKSGSRRSFSRCLPPAMPK